MALLQEMTITNQYGKTSNIDQNTGEETSFVGQDVSFQYGNYTAVYGMKKVNSSSTPDENITSETMPARVYVPQNLQIPQVGDKIFVIIEGTSHCMIGYIGGYDAEGGSSSGSTTPISILVPNINGDYDIDLGAIPEALNDKTDRDLKNLDNTGEAKLKANIQLVNELPANQETGVLYIIPE